MKRFKSIVTGALAIAIAFGSITLPAPQLFAQQPGSASMSVAPKKTYLMEPGMVENDTLVIRNIDRNSPLNLTLRVIDFTYTDDGGTAKFFLDPNAEPTTWSAKPFLDLPETVSIPPSQSKSIDIKVSVPKNQGAGSFYSAIVYSTSAPDGGNVGLAASVSTLAFVNVPGEVRQDLKLEKFGPYDQISRTYSSFMFTEPTVIGYTVKNSGNVVEAPVGSITLRDMFGRETVINDLNQSGSLALIGQTRTFNSCIKSETKDVELDGKPTRQDVCVTSGLWPGIYTAKADLYYGQNGNPTKELHGTTLFFYFPLWFIVALLIFIAVAAFYIRKLVRWINHRLNGGVKLKKRK